MPVSAKQLKRIQQLFALVGSDSAGERETAWAKLDELLQKLRMSWNDLPGLLNSSNDSAGNGDVDEEDPAEPSAGAPNALELVHYMLQEFVDLKSPAEYVAVALWILHTHIFHQFSVTPRLALVSPVRGCGKTTLLELLERLSARAQRTDSISPAALYRMIDHQPCTLLVDEVDNADLENSGLLRAVLNSGHRQGGCVTRVISGEPKRFLTFSPVAISAIGALPLPIMARSIVIRMQRRADDARTFLRRLDDVNATVDLDLAYRHAFMWARAAKLIPNPRMPTELTNRAADNWRPLIAVADSFGPHWGAAARDAAIALLDGHDEDVGVTLLSDIRSIFDDLRVDRIPSRELVERLVDMEDAGWSEFRGLHDDQPPRRLSQGRLASLLKPFEIHPRSIWPPQRRDESRSRKGYTRAQFQVVWDKYCRKAGTPAQSSKIKHLRK